jgi:NitT/TauT family transport system ATP-binding protein
LLRLVAGLGEPTSGNIHRRADIAARRGAIGFVFQDATLMPWATLFDNVRLPLRIIGSGRSAAVTEAIELVGLSGFERAYPHELSGGMRMRASIARALVTKPSLLLLDEPFAALDEITRFRLNDELLSLWHRLGLTVIFVSHSIFESAYLSQRIELMTPRPGRIAREFRLTAEYPRDKAYRTSQPFNAVCQDISAALDEVMSVEPVRP